MPLQQKEKISTNNDSAEFGADLVAQVLSFDAEEGLLPLEAGEIAGNKLNAQVVPALQRYHSKQCQAFSAANESSLQVTKAEDARSTALQRDRVGEEETRSSLQSSPLSSATNRNHPSIPDLISYLNRETSSNYMCTHRRILLLATRFWRGRWIRTLRLEHG